MDSETKVATLAVFMLLEKKRKKAEYDVEYNKKNRERIAKYRREYHKKNKEDNVVRAREWRLAHKERHAEYLKEYYQKNKDRWLEHAVKNKEHIAARAREYNKTHGKCKSEACAVYDVEERKKAYIQGLCKLCFNILNPGKAKTKVRAEHLFLADVEELLPHLAEDAAEVIWDCPIRGTTNCTLKKPDMLWVFVDDNGGRYSMHLEIDENGEEHEDDDTRVADIQKAIDSQIHYLVRVNTKGCTRRKRLANGEFHYVGVEPAFSDRVGEMCEELMRVWELVRSGVPPDEDDWKTMVGFST
jgi:ferredoxin